MISAYLCALVCISFLIITSPASAQVDDPFLSETPPLTKDAPARPLNRAKPMPSAPTGPPASSKQPSGPFLPQSNAKPAVPPQSAKSAPATLTIFWFAVLFLIRLWMAARRRKKAARGQTESGPAVEP